MRKQDLQNLVDANLASGSQILAVKHREVETALINEIAILYEVKELDCPDAFRTANFDGTGLGINLMVGWAICNGANGTKNRSGRTSIGYDATNYATLGAVGGSKDAVVVSHNHDEYASQTPTGGTSGIISSPTALGSGVTYLKTSTEGVSGVDKNMQPYIVTLFIQRIS